MGHYRIRRGQCGLYSADRLADPARWADQTFCWRDSVIRDFFVALRARTDLADLAHRAGFTRRRCRAVDSAVAGNLAGFVSEGESVDGAFLMGDDRRGRTDCRAGSGCLDYRQV